MKPNRPQHPSGRPKIGVLSVWRIPGMGPVTPGLQREEPANAIGFMANLTAPFPDDGE